MNSDFRVSCSFPHHHKTKKLMRKLGAQGVVSLVFLWSHVAQNRPEGALSGWDNDDIAIAAQWPGEPDEFVEALVAIGFISKQQPGNVLVVHDWEHHNGFASGHNRRSQAARENIRKRWDKSGSVIPNSYGGNTVVSESEYGGNTPSPSPYPNPLPNPNPIPSPNPENPSSPVGPSDSTAIESRQCYDALCSALGKLSCSDQEIVIWQALEKNGCTLEDVESARKKKFNNHLAYLKNIVCQERDKRTGTGKEQSFDEFMEEMKAKAIAEEKQNAQK